MFFYHRDERLRLSWSVYSTAPCLMGWYPIIAQIQAGVYLVNFLHHLITKLIIVNSHANLWTPFIIQCLFRTCTVLRAVWHPWTLTRGIPYFSFTKTLGRAQGGPEKLFETEWTFSIVIIGTEDWCSEDLGRVAQYLTEVGFWIVSLIVDRSWWCFGLLGMLH